MKGLMWLGVLGLVLLCLLCPWCRAPAIEDDVRSAATACAVEAGLDPGMISVSGRDVTLTGMVASEAVVQSLTNCIEGFAGTRKIDNQLTVLGPGTLGFHTRYGDVTISGVAPTFDTHDAIIDEAIGLWGAESVTDRLEADPTRTIGGWTDDDFAQFLAALHHYRKDLDIELTNGQAIISGTVLSELARERVLGGAEALLPGFEIVDHLTVREPTTDREALQAELDALLAGWTVECETDSANQVP